MNKFFYVEKVGVVNGTTIVKSADEKDDKLYVIVPIDSVSFGKKVYDNPEVKVVEENVNKID